MKRLELTGQVFGRLTVIGFSHIGSSGASYWHCQCECGQHRIIYCSSLTRNVSTSCGCLNKERFTHFKHGHDCQGNRSQTFNSWRAMKERCYNPNNNRYSIYGERGIKVCEQWVNDFPQFLKDMGERPEGLTLDRINVNGNYEPSNCRWADRHTQRINRRLKPKMEATNGTRI
jgi:hypothetical protein